MGGTTGDQATAQPGGMETHDEFPGGSVSSEGGTDRTAHLPTA